ncbi:hypothetical protein NTHI1209_01598 [Haemophilus influenzae]|uniref:Uncharacterized protein n=1 Tax=Haemophilus influenzae TaxID=727 RepID=A0A158SYN1_HAEIF|nr:hypothetical protein NTHI1209_01598 [Haemophilus influenzae]
MSYRFYLFSSKLFLIWGNDGSVIDLIFPLGILALIMGYVQVQNKTL